MRLRYALSLAMLPGVLLAQSDQRIELPEHRSGKHQGYPDARNTQGSIQRDTDYYFEDFDNGLNGWTITTPVGSVNWELTNVGPGPTSSTYPVPVLNTSTAGGWMMVDDDFYGVPGQSTETWLVSPVIDLSEAPAFLKVEFDQFFQEWQAESCFVGVSTNGGITWSEVEINEGVGRDGRPNPEVVDIDITEWVASDPGNVQLRFRYVSEWDYGWQIDNVAIRELPENDMALLTPRRTIYDFAEYGREFLPYTIYPASQIQALDFNAVLRNKGYATQTGVSLSVSVEGPDGPVFSGSSTPFTAQAGTTSNAFISPWTPPTTAGEYTVSFDVQQDQADDAPGNNSDTQSFQVSENTYALDEGACNNVLSQGPDNENDTFEVGHFFEFPNSTTITAVQVAVHESTDPGAVLYAIVYSDIGVGTTSVVAESDEYEVQADDLNPLGGSTFITIPLTSPLQVQAGSLLVVMAGFFASSDAIGFCTSGIIPSQIAIIRYPNTSDPNFTVSRAPMVRPMVGGNVGVLESDATAPGFDAWPNPFRDVLDLRMDMANAGRVAVELRDMTGRLVLTEDLGMRPAGEQRWSLDLANLAGGLYTCTVLADGRRISRTVAKAAQ